MASGCCAPSSPSSTRCRPGAAASVSIACVPSRTTSACGSARRSCSSAKRRSELRACSVLPAGSCMAASRARCVSGLTLWRVPSMSHHSGAMPAAPASRSSTIVSTPPRRRCGAAASTTASTARGRAGQRVGVEQARRCRGAAVDRHLPGEAVARCRQRDRHRHRARGAAPPRHGRPRRRRPPPACRRRPSRPSSSRSPRAKPRRAAASPRGSRRSGNGRGGAPDARAAAPSAARRMPPAPAPPPPSRARWWRCPARRRCCCRAACGPAPTPIASIGVPRASSSVASSARWSASRAATHRRIVARPLDAVVPGDVVVAAVAVALAVGVVVLAGVADQVGEREAVMRDHEVDAARGQPAGGEQIGRAGEPGGEIAGALRVAAPEPAHAVAEMVVPLAPGAAGTAPSR